MILSTGFYFLPAESLCQSSVSSCNSLIIHSIESTTIFVFTFSIHFDLTTKGTFNSSLTCSKVYSNFFHPWKCWKIHKVPLISINLQFCFFSRVKVNWIMQVYICSKGKLYQWVICWKKVSTTVWQILSWACFSDIASPQLDQKWSTKYGEVTLNDCRFEIWAPNLALGGLQGQIKRVSKVISFIDSSKFRETWKS